MSVSTIPRRKSRPPRLKVVGNEPRLRHRCSWTVSNKYVVLEFWRADEWAALADWERPANTHWLPGIGHVSMSNATEEEGQNVRAELRDIQDYWRSK